MYRLIVFDLDGTLVDSRRDIAESANALLETCGAHPLPEETIGRMVGDGAPTLVARAFAAAGIERPPDALDRFLAIYDTRLLKHTRPYPQMPEVLEALGACTPLAVLTNKPLAATRSILSGLGLARHFDDEAIIGGDGPFARKPDPGGLRHLVSRAGVPSSAALLVGDSIIDWRAAKNASTGVCLARYGFGFEGFPVDELRPSDRFIDAPSDLLKL
ncbi:MAG TPA: HAD-IA family hydrolase [Vicinamibacterales bacterium]